MTVLYPSGTVESHNTARQIAPRHPVNPAFRTVYLQYLMRSLPAVARGVSSNPDAYVYLAESIRAWPDQEALAGRIAAAGPWDRVGWRNLSGGIVALHRATRV